MRASADVAAELAARHAWHRTPVYRRHLLLLLLAALAGLPWALTGPWAPGLLRWACATAGAALGLALSCLPLFWRRWLLTLSWQHTLDGQLGVCVLQLQALTWGAAVAARCASNAGSRPGLQRQ